MLTEQPLDQRVTIRLTKLEKAILLEDANLAQLTLSELIRRRYFGRPIIAGTDAATIRELRRIGGLLKHIWNESGSTYNNEIGSTLLILKQYIETLAHHHHDLKQAKPK
jgi:hypothetical protein